MIQKRIIEEFEVCWVHAGSGHALAGPDLPLIFYIRYQLIEALAVGNVQVASSVIRVPPNNFHIVRGGVLTDHVQPVFELTDSFTILPPLNP